MSRKEHADKDKNKYSHNYIVFDGLIPTPFLTEDVAKIKAELFAETPCVDGNGNNNDEGQGLNHITFRRKWD